MALEYHILQDGVRTVYHDISKGPCIPPPKDGDMLFRYYVKSSKEEKCVVYHLVSSAYVSSASPLLAKMCREAIKDKATKGSECPCKYPTVSVQESASIFRIIMDIIHGNVYTVPKVLDPEDLILLAHTAEKYALVEHLESWGKHMMAALDEDDLLMPGLQDLIHVCSVFQHPPGKLYPHLVAQLEVRQRKGKETIVFEDYNTGKLHTFSHFVKDDVREKLVHSRQQIIDRLRSTIEHLYQTYSAQERLPPSMRCKKPKPALDCRYLQWQHLIRAMDTYDLLGDTFWSQSVNKIMWKLEEILEEQYFNYKDNIFLRSHTECGWADHLLEVAERELNNPEILGIKV